MSVLVVVLAVLAGGLGAGARFVVDGAARSRWVTSLPWGTTAINTTGSFVLGLLVGLAQGHGLASPVEVVAGTGFLGGYTTFSTASFEVARLLQQRRHGAAALHALVMLGGGLAAATAGVVVGSS